jgi:hypothetical protein
MALLESLKEFMKKTDDSQSATGQDLNWLPSELESDTLLEPICMVEELAGRSPVPSVT